MNEEDVIKFFEEYFWMEIKEKVNPVTYSTETWLCTYLRGTKLQEILIHSD